MTLPINTGMLAAKLKKQIELVEEKIVNACALSRRQRDEVLRIAVTKSVTSNVAAQLLDFGICDLGESRPQELWRKHDALPKTVRWHQIGHLQRNKIDKTLPMVTMIHSVDSVRLLHAIEKECRKQSRDVDVLIEVNASGEKEKHGFAPDDMNSVIDAAGGLQHVHICGLMTMAAFEDDMERCRPTFRLLREMRDEYASKFSPPHRLQELSMGMSNDFPVAIEEGATIIRLGSILFEGVTQQ